MTYWYISFATDKDGFLGATVVEASDTIAALEEANRLKLNPGGEALVIQIPEGMGGPDPRTMLNRIIGIEELTAMGAKKLGDYSPEEQETIRAHIDTICLDCNKKE